MDKAKQDKNISAFLSFSPIYRWEITEYEHYDEVRFTDLRYRNDGYYPFVAVVQIDNDMNILSSYTGWIFSEQKLQNKLALAHNPRSEEHTSELQSRGHLVCRLLLEKKK